MKRASRLFDEQQKQRIDDTMAEAESKTSAEIVPVVTTSSGRYDRAGNIMGIWVGGLALVVLWLLLPESTRDGSWSGISPAAKLGYMLLGMVVGFLLGVTMASRISTLRRLFTPSQQMRDEVATRSRQAFFDASVHHTACGTGLLVYISLYERMSAVLADQAILDKLGQGTVDQLCLQLTKTPQSGDATAALCQTVQRVGEELEHVLPRAHDDVNELPDKLITID